MKALARAFTMTDEACRSPRESMERVYAVRSHPRDDPCHLEPPCGLAGGRPYLRLK